MEEHISDLSSSEVARRSVKASVILLAGSLISNILLLVNVLIIARLLGHNLYGEYSLSVAPVTIFILFSGIGINTAITRYSAYHLSRGEIEEARRKTVNGIRFLLLLGVVLTIISYLSSPFIASNLFHRPALEPYIRLASLAVIGQVAYQCGIASLVGWGSTKNAGASYIVQAVVKVAIAPTLILLGFGVFGAVVAQVSSLLVAASLAIFGLYFLKLRGGSKDNAKNFLSDVKSLIKFGIPSEIGSYFSSFAGQNYVVIVLGIFASDAIVGYFQAATNVTAIISVFSTSIILSLFAGFSALHGQKGDTGLGFVYAVKYVSFAGTPIIFFIIAA
jgi:O-antigen/teichoic acid export membrane protein